ncbi:hypothetical protein ACQQ2Q_18820 [Agrobacterium sp. ES01]|uniref:hypothetical protein n=1 Tax=Agrobacterium sp. ES01 TaxID=3420714 RepID=UPI003D0F885E
MVATKTTPSAERQQDLLALMNMLGYAQNAAKDMGASVAASLINDAVIALLPCLQKELPDSLAAGSVAQLSQTRSGHC